MIRPRSPVLQRARLFGRARAFSHQGLTKAGRPRSVLSRFWTPTGGVSAAEGESGHDTLVRASFLRQAQTGVFQLLPLGLRVQQKIEALLDKHMQSIGASRLSLSTITSEELWRKSGRFEQVSSELFRFEDRRKTPLMLSPTHEEEITTLVAGAVNSYKDLPLRLYQITRKYRDEMRPRHGLLRSREFVMKDLYTFDKSPEAALDTYREVSEAYRAFFADLKLPVLVSQASSGTMGGDHSHEYLLTSPTGEDIVVTCDNCGYTAGAEVAMAQKPPTDEEQANGRGASAADFGVWHGVTKDRKTLVNAWHPRHTDINFSVVREAVPELDLSVSDPVQALSRARQASADGPAAPLRVVNVVDLRLAPAFPALHAQLPVLPAELRAAAASQSVVRSTPTGGSLDLLRPAHGDACPRCEAGSLGLHRALELGHTFYLGARYSEPLGLTALVPSAAGGGLEPAPVQMGCYGIGVSRILGAAAEHGADAQGLRWPRAVAPFEVAVVPTGRVSPEAVQLFDALVDHGAPGPGIDAVLDDRERNFGWKIKDADTIGYPVVVILGRPWRERGVCQVQCRSLGLQEDVPAGDMGGYLEGLLSRL